MARELEIKLEMSPEAAARIVPWLQGRAAGPLRTREISSIYYDTPDEMLRAHGLSLRLREADGARLQTVKAGDGADRGEWERAIDGDGPNLKAAAKTPLAALPARKLKRELRPAFESRVQRTSALLRAGRGRVEVAIDQGSVAAGAYSDTLCEVELELKTGSRKDLAQAVRDLAEAAPSALGVLSKADRGFALRAGRASKAVKGESIALKRGVSAVEAFEVIGWACLKHALANREAVRRRDPEGIHQMRVGLRRLRAALSAFRRVVGAPNDIKAELKWLTDELGPARDLDVLLAKTLVPRARAHNSPQLNDLIADLTMRRAAAFERARRAVESERYGALTLKVALWLLARDTPPALLARGRGKAKAFAQDVLAARAKQAMKKLRKLDKLDVRQRHKLRIQVKKLRYASAFFASLEPLGAQKRRARWDEKLKAMQDGLGRLNDFAVHERLAGELTQSWAQENAPAATQSGRALALGLALGAEQAANAAGVADVKKAGKKLKAAQTRS